MADATAGVTPEGLKSKLIEQLQAQHVEIEDLSGMNMASGYASAYALSVIYTIWEPNILI